MTDGPEYGLVLCSQFPPGDDATARFTEQVEQVHHVRDAGFTSVWATQHYLAEEFQYLHPLAVLGRLIPETGDMRIDGEAGHLDGVRPVPRPVQRPALAPTVGAPA